MVQVEIPVKRKWEFIPTFSTEFLLTINVGLVSKQLFKGKAPSEIMCFVEYIMLYGFMIITTIINGLEL
jgi:hypothetical protein